MATYLLDGLALGDLRMANHLVWRADLDEGELGLLGDLGSQGGLAAVRRPCGQTAFMVFCMTVLCWEYTPIPREQYG